MLVAKYDVVVLGAGVNGTSIAYELCKRGKRVALVDKVVLGAGASGSCDDMILLQSKKPGILLEMAFKSLELFQRLKSELKGDIEFENRGGTILIEDQDDLTIMEEFVANQNRFGLDVEIVDAKRLRSFQPYVSSQVIASTYSPRDSQVNPLALMRALLGSATALGLVFLRRTFPVSIEPRSSGWAVSLESGDLLETETVINATGAWAGDVMRLIGVNVPIKPRKGQVLVTEALPAVGRTNVWSARYIVSKLKPRVAPPESSPGSKPSAEARFGIGFAFTATHNGNYLVGSTREDAGFDKTTDPEALAILSNQVVHFFPVMRKINFIRSFAGLRPSTPDGMPFLGEVPGAPGFFVAAGHEGDGIALAPITGALVADLVEGRPPSFPLDAFRIDRFSV